MQSATGSLSQWRFAAPLKGHDDLQLLSEINLCDLSRLPELRLAYNDGYSARTLRELLEIVEDNKVRIERAWNEFFR